MAHSSIPKGTQIPLVNPEKTQRENIKAGAHYLLPLEVSALQSRFDRLVGRQDGLSTLWNEAMNQSSETFHDNAPAEVLHVEAFNIGAEADKIIKVMRDATRLDYPQDTSSVLIGNIVTIAYEDDDAPERTLITGYTSKVDVSEIGLEDVNVVSAGSPLGFALLESRPGQHVEYDTGRRVFSVGILAVEAVIPTGEMSLTE